jgi:hypothetical protein
MQCPVMNMNGLYIFLEQNLLHCSLLLRVRDAFEKKRILILQEFLFAKPILYSP